MKPWVPFTLIALCAATPAFSWGPSLDRDEISSSTQFGSSFLLQTLSVNRHFNVKPDTHNEYFVEKQDAVPRKRSPEEEQQDIEKARDSLNLSWMLGYAYYRSGAPTQTSTTATYDDTHAFAFGLSLGLSRRASASIMGTYQTLPSESYDQGMGEFAFRYIIPLNAESGVNENEDNAEAYYVSKYQDLNREHLPAGSRYPHISLGILGGYYKNTKRPMSTPRSTSEQTLTSNELMNINSAGPEFVLSLNPLLYFKLKMTYYAYDRGPQGFLQDTTVIGGVRPKSNLAVADMEGTLPLLMVFPMQTASASTGLNLGRQVAGRFGITYATFRSTGFTGAGIIDNTISLGGIIDFYLSRGWKLGGSLDVTNGANSYRQAVAGINLGYSL